MDEPPSLQELADEVGLSLRKIKEGLYYTELSWIKKVCEKNFGNFQCVKHNLLPNDVTIIIKKLS